MSESLWLGTTSPPPLARPPDAVIREPLELFRPVDVAQVDQHRLLHHALEAVEIEGAELLPFGDDDEGVGAFRAGIGALAEFDSRKHLPGLRHADRVVGPHARP